MFTVLNRLIACAVIGSALPAAAYANAYDDGRAVNSARELAPYLQCVPYAREQSGIKIYGDAHTWWDQAEGRFDRGSRPKVGAVMAFQPYRNMRLGHVAAVSRIVDRRTVLLRHSNWSPINGRRGQIENDVKAVDVSPNNDWSQVRVWYHPSQGLGRTAWPIHGFIYPEKPPSFAQTVRIARAAPPAKPVSRKPSRAFLSAFSEFSAKPAPRNLGRRNNLTSKPTAARVDRVNPHADDQVAAAISRYD